MTRWLHFRLRSGKPPGPARSNGAEGASLFQETRQGYPGAGTQSPILDWHWIFQKLGVGKHGNPLDFIPYPDNIGVSDKLKIG